MSFNTNIAFSRLTRLIYSEKFVISQNNIVQFETFVAKDLSKILPPFKLKKREKKKGKRRKLISF